jgi:hypothetical protein
MEYLLLLQQQTFTKQIMEKAQVQCFTNSSNKKQDKYKTGLFAYLLYLDLKFIIETFFGKFDSYFERNTTLCNFFPSLNALHLQQT